MQEECLICKTPLEYLDTDVLMECAICHKQEPARPAVSTAIMYAASVIPMAWMPSSLIVCIQKVKTLLSYWSK